MGSTAVADIRNESYREYTGRIEDTYIEGYDPVSLGAPHASLSHTKTWVAMGLLLSCLFGVGLAVWGAGAMAFGFGSQTHDLAERLLILGVAEAVITGVAGGVLIAMGRKDYKEYRKRTGRRN